MLVLMLTLAADNLCATRAVQCLQACSGDAICVTKCSRYQSTCEKNRDTQERLQAPHKCFDAFGAPIRCEVMAPKTPQLDRAALEKLASVVKVPSQKAWKDDAKATARGKVLEVKQ